MMDRVTKQIIGAGLIGSLGACLFLVWLIYFNEGVGNRGEWVGALPTVNAGLNSLSALMVVLGIVAIKRGKKITHRIWMGLALLSSACFLVGYIIYHAYHGDTPYIGTGIWRPIYFSILITHIILTIFGLPLVLITAGLGLFKRFSFHKTLGRFTYPIWMIISITGVVVYGMLKVSGSSI